MANIRHRIGINAPRRQVFESLTTISGLSEWWTETIKGDPQVGGTLQFFFGGREPSTSMKISKCNPEQYVEWECVQGPEEWVGTQISFSLTHEDGETVLLFNHAGWSEPVEFMYHCSTKWGYFLLGLKTRIEGGQSVAYPHDMHISKWDS